MMKSTTCACSLVFQLCALMSAFGATIMAVEFKFALVTDLVGRLSKCATLDALMYVEKYFFFISFTLSPTQHPGYLA